SSGPRRAPDHLNQREPRLPHRYSSRDLDVGSPSNATEISSARFAKTLAISAIGVSVCMFTISNIGVDGDARLEIGGFQRYIAPHLRFSFGRRTCAAIFLFDVDIRADHAAPSRSRR